MPIFAYVPREDDSVWGYPEIYLELQNVPYDDDVRDLVKHHRGEFKEGNPGAQIRLALKPDESSIIRALAKAIRHVVGRGQEYDNSNWKWIARMGTYEALDRFATVHEIAGQVWKKAMAGQH